MVLLLIYCQEDICEWVAIGHPLRPHLIFDNHAHGMMDLEAVQRGHLRRCTAHLLNTFRVEDWSWAKAGTLDLAALFLAGV